MNPTSTPPILLRRPQAFSRRTTVTIKTLSVLGLLGCASAEAQPAPTHPLAASAPPMSGKNLFETAVPGSNGRSCASCHVLAEDTTLKPDSVAARLAANPADPLFNRLDADDPTAAVLTFENLKKGLVRVVLPLPDNMDVIDAGGRVITPPDRTIFVWRGVPTVANTALTAPYQADGREPTLQHQAQSAVISHSEGPKVLPTIALDKVAAFERGVFSSERAWFVSVMADLGVPRDKIPVPEDFMALSEAEKRGRTVYNSACQPCHGSASTDRIVNAKVHEFLSFSPKPDGNLRFEVKPGQPPTPVRTPRPNLGIVNAGFAVATYTGQIGVDPTFFNVGAKLPRYRFRFYKDATRTEAVTELPPVPVTVSGNPFDLRPLRDSSGAPIVGPNLIPQLFSTDPGRAAITGDPLDFEAFDVPQLRGIARTAPYMHDNSFATLKDVVDSYSRFLLPFLAPLNLPVHPPEKPGGRKEGLSPTQKQDLLAFLQRL
jgi:cytochrome c peroxidase